MSPPAPFAVTPIGRVTSARGAAVDDDWDAVEASITLDEAYDPVALAGLGDFSHVEVVYLFDRVDPGSVERAARHPRGNPAWPEVGIFAQRAKDRPNRIGVTVCRILGVEGRSVTVAGLDAIDGTPVLDLKPHMAEFAARGPQRQPAWSRQLMAGYWAAPAGGGERESATTRRSYDLVAARYAAKIGPELAGKPLDRALLDAVAEGAGGAPVLDLGCGPGHVAGYLAQRGSAVVGVDLSPGMCSVADRSGVAAAAGDLVALPVRTGSAAAVVCWYAVIHLDRDGRAAAYAEVARVLRPGGQAVVAFHAGSGERVVEEWWGMGVALTFRWLDPDEEVALAAGAGLSLTARLDRAPLPGEHQSHRTYPVLAAR